MIFKNILFFIQLAVLINYSVAGRGNFSPPPIRASASTKFNPPPIRATTSNTLKFNPPPIRATTSNTPKFNPPPIRATTSNQSNMSSYYQPSPSHKTTIKPIKTNYTHVYPYYEEDQVNIIYPTYPARRHYYYSGGGDYNNAGAAIVCLSLFLIVVVVVICVRRRNC